MNLKPLKPLIQPLGDGSVILYDRITTWISSPKYRTPEQPEPPAERQQPAKGQQKKGDQAADGKGEQKKPAPAEEPKPVLDKRAPLKRVGLLLGCAYVTAVSDYTTYATATAALGWVVAAYMVGTPDETPAKAEPGTPFAAPASPRDAIVQWLTETIGDRPGIHLYELYPRMLALPGMEKHDEAALREALTTLDIPITRAFTIGDIRGRSGVRLTDLAAPSPLRKTSPSPQVKTQVRPAALPPKSSRRAPPLPLKSPPPRPDACPIRPSETGGEGSRTARPQHPRRHPWHSPATSSPPPAPTRTASPSRAAARSTPKPPRSRSDGHRASRRPGMDVHQHRHRTDPHAGLHPVTPRRRPTHCQATGRPRAPSLTRQDHDHGTPRPPRFGTPLRPAAPAVLRPLRRQLPRPQPLTLNPKVCKVLQLLEV